MNRFSKALQTACFVRDKEGKNNSVPTLFFLAIQRPDRNKINVNGNNCFDVYKKMAPNLFHKFSATDNDSWFS